MNIRRLVKNFILCLVIFGANTGFADEINMPKDFVYLTDVDPTIIENVRYRTNENFMGRPVPGYVTDRIICTRVAAETTDYNHVIIH